MYLGWTGWVHPRYFVHFLVMYLRCTGPVHWPLPPVCSANVSKLKRPHPGSFCQIFDLPCRGGVSRTQVTTQDITQLCNEIRDIRTKRPKANKDILNKDTTINIVPNSTPDQAQDTHERDDHDGVWNGDNRSRPDLPTYNPDNQARCAPPPPPSQTESAGTPPAPLSSRTPPASAARTSSLASSNAVEDLEALPSDECTASCSPDSPDETKASSRW